MNNNTNKYKDTISKIQASDELKKRIIERMEQENTKSVNKGGIFMKIKNAMIAIITTLAILIGSGAVYAAMGGTIFGKPALEWLGIGFSEKYEEYVVPVENQTVKNEKVQLDLISTVSDEGFVVLNYKLTYSDEFIKEVKDRYMAKGWTEEKLANIDVLEPTAISFNDLKYQGQWHQINSSYDTVIIDGKEFILRGRAEKDIQTVKVGKEYEIYVLYFLADYELEGKDEFTLTLKKPIIKLIDDRNILESEYLEIDGQFDIEVSKTKAIKNSDKIEGNNNEIKIGNFTDKLNKVMLTPLQNIIKITNRLTNRTEESTFNLTDKDYIGEAKYKLFSTKDGELIPMHVICANIEYIHKDGTRTKAGPEEGEEIPELLDGDTIEYTTYIVFEQRADIKDLELKVYSENEYYNTVKLMGIYNINLNKESITTETKNENLDITSEQFYRFEDLYNHVTGKLMSIEEYNRQAEEELFGLAEDINDIENEVVETPKVELPEQVYMPDGSLVDDDVKAIRQYYNAMELYNDMTGDKFEMSQVDEKILSKDGKVEVQGRQALNFDEVVDKVFSKNGKEQYVKSIDSRATAQNGKAYLINAARGTDVTYINTDLVLQKRTENRIEYTAKARYINWTELTDNAQDLAENFDEYAAKATFVETNFVLVKENGNWVVEDFTLPN